ncbi:MAG: hypothetical protein R2762_28325 [Bryobacteraceae bacterium]
MDDTDRSTVENTKPIYDLLGECGFRTTKTVWPLEPTGHRITGGDTLENAQYRDWALDLQKQGFEIAIHGATDYSSPRPRVAAAFDRFRETFGADPSVHVNHVGQVEGLYWGSTRFDPPVSWLYSQYRRGRGSNTYLGSDESSPYFWGDICRSRVKYVRNFVFAGINTLSYDPLMPYHDPARPYVRYWFSSSYGSGAKRFISLLSEANQDQLAAEGGACIVYTHLGSGFYPVQAEVKRLLVRLSRMGGWYVPATQLLDHLGDQRGWADTSRHRFTHQRMQWSWLWQQALSSVGGALK